MKSNFVFLDKYWPALAQIGGLAENYLYSDPNTCMYKLGFFAERLVQEIMIFEGVPEPKVISQSNRIRALKRAGLLPPDIDTALYTLRKNRNDAVHTGADSIDNAKMLLSLTHNLAAWFMQTYGDWSYSAEKFILPEEKHISDINHIIAEQEKRIAELTAKLEAVKTVVSDKTRKDRAKRGNTVASMMEWSKKQTRFLTGMNCLKKQVMKKRSIIFMMAKEQIIKQKNLP